MSAHGKDPRPAIPDDIDAANAYWDSDAKRWLSGQHSEFTYSRTEEKYIRISTVEAQFKGFIERIKEHSKEKTNRRFLVAESKIPTSSPAAGKPPKRGKEDAARKEGSSRAAYCNAMSSQAFTMPEKERFLFVDVEPGRHGHVEEDASATAAQASVKDQVIPRVRARPANDSSSPADATPPKRGTEDTARYIWELF